MLVFAWVATLNASVLWIWYVQKRKAPSRIPLLGGVAGSIGIWLLPLAAAHKWWWAPLVVDLGCLPLILHAAVHYLVVRPDR
jgi:hypothetical protein